ncbi:MAG TPA: hypothetical protein VIS48_01425 [Candidatus Kryptonia bacterium]
MNLRLFMSLLLLFAGCLGERSTTPPDIPYVQLSSSPDTLALGGPRLYLTAYLWVQQDRFSGPGGYDSLFGVVYATSVDSISLDPILSVDAVWIIMGNGEVWKSWLSPMRARISLYCVSGTFRGGPVMAVGTKVTVVVRLIDSQGMSYLLRASNQEVTTPPIVVE